MSSIVSELLESVHEPLMRTVAFLEAAADAPKQVKDGLRQSFEAVERDLYGQAGYTVAQMDWLTEQMAKGAKGSAHAGTAQDGAAGAVDDAGFNYGPDADQMEAISNARMRPNPRNVIRGSGSTRSGGKKSRRA
jgi:hypothetical protein